MDELLAQGPGPLVLRRAHVPACLAGLEGGDGDGLVLVDLAVEGGVLAGIDPHEPARGDGIDLKGRMVWPCPIDLHTHLDKGHIWPRARNPDGTFAAALETVGRDRVARWSAEDVRARMEFALRSALAHGTCAIRTHLDSIPPQDGITWPVFADVRERWAGRITLQGVALAMPEHYAGAGGEALAARVAEHGGILGLVPRMTPSLDADLDRLFELAARYGLEVDCHIDESLEPGERTLRHLAQASLRNGFKGGVTAGHCCSLAVQDEGEVERTLDLVAQAGIAIVSLPLCNLYLQDRVPARTPRRRGVTLAHEIRARGIPLAFASDNTRDPFYAYGDLDLLEVFREAVRIAHLDHPFAGWVRSVTATPAGIMGLKGRGLLRRGDPADLVIFEGRRWSEVLSRPEPRRVVLRGGEPIPTVPPPYADLDPLFA